MNRNDFTLDELHLIHENLHWNECPEKNEKLIMFNRKLEKLFEEYCDHDFEQSHIEIDIKNCTKCGVIQWVAAIHAHPLFARSADISHASFIVNEEK